MIMGNQGGNLEETTSTAQSKKWQFYIARSLLLPMSSSMEEQQEVKHGPF
jgi:hypothetical protein